MKTTKMVFQEYKKIIESSNVIEKKKDEKKRKEIKTKL